MTTYKEYLKNQAKWIDISRKKQQYNWNYLTGGEGNKYVHGRPVPSDDGRGSNNDTNTIVYVKAKYWKDYKYEIEVVNE